MKQVLVLNEERELLILLRLGLGPIMPIVGFIFSWIIYFLIIVIFWIAIFSIVYIYCYSRIVVNEKEIIIKVFRKEYVIFIDDIMYLKRVRNINYINHVHYYIKLKKSVLIPNRFLTIKNQKFNELIENNILEIPIISTMVV